MSSIKHISFWEESINKLKLPTLEKNIKIDTAIIGSGIFGLTTALMLQEEGKEVAVFEANEIGSGATSCTTAKVTSLHRLIYQDILNNYGEKMAKQYADANEEAIRIVEANIKKYKIDCDYKNLPHYVYAITENGLKKIQKEYDATVKLGLPSSIGTQAKIPFEYEAALKFDNQGIFHPLKYLYGIGNVLLKNNVPIYVATRIVKIDGDKPYILQAKDGLEIEAQNVVIATKYPILNKKSFLVAKLYVMRTYIVAGFSDKIKLDGAFINAEDPVRSLRTYSVGDKNLVLIVGASHQTGECKDTHKPYEELIAYAKKLDPDMEIRYKWSTQDCLSLDNIPYIGSLSEDMPNVYVGTGFSKWGMTNGTIGAKIITDFIMERDNPWKEVFSPSRSLSVKSAKQLAILTGDLIGDLAKKIVPAGQIALLDIKNDEGKVIEHDGHKIGVYRDVEGYLHLIDPTCRHMGCQLNFNQAEKSWDCPCHGSRYTYNGEVIEAPAVKNLEKVDLNTDS